MRPTSLMVFLPLLPACVEIKIDFPGECAGSDCEHDSGAVSGDSATETGETGAAGDDSGDDSAGPTDSGEDSAVEADPSTCEDLDTPTTTGSWEHTEPAATWSDEGRTCDAVDFEDWELALEWSVTDIDTFLMNVVVAPQDGAPWSTVFVERFYEVDLYDGRDGALIETIDLDAESEDGSTPAVGDADGDGDLEFVSTTWAFARLVDLGTGEQIAMPFEDTVQPPDEVSAWLDADGDGTLDAIFMDSAWTLDGRMIASWEEGRVSTGFFGADLDSDGAPEVVTAAGIYQASDGTGTTWDPTIMASGPNAMYAGPVQVDGEVHLWFANGYGTTWLTEADGEIVSSSTTGGNGWLASIGDVDGDRAPEMCVFDREEGVISMLTLEGDALWSWTVCPYCLSGGCTLADLDADGLYEVLLNTWNGFALVDGATGVALDEIADLTTTARDSAPVVADIDGDRSAEILVASGQELYVYGAASGRFARTRPVWHQLPYDITSIQDDGTLVSWPRASWETYNAFRAQPAHDGEHPDLVVEVLDTCAESCEDGPVGVLVRVGNRGSVEAAAGAVLRLYTVADGPVELASLTLDEPLATDEAIEAWVWVDPDDLSARVAVDVTAADADECDLVNNRQMVRLACE